MEETLYEAEGGVFPCERRGHNEDDGGLTGDQRTSRVANCWPAPVPRR